MVKSKIFVDEKKVEWKFLRGARYRISTTIGKTEWSRLDHCKKHKEQQKHRKEDGFIDQQWIENIENVPL